MDEGGGGSVEDEVDAELETGVDYVVLGRVVATEEGEGSREGWCCGVRGNRIIRHDGALRYIAR